MIKSEDGKTYTFHQSWINTFMMCPERARAEAYGLVERTESDAAAVGTAMHLAIETFLQGGVTPQQALDAGVAEFDRIAAMPNFEWVKVKTRDTAIQHVTACFNGWHTNVLREIGSIEGLERSFDVQLCTHNGIEIRLAGTIDLIADSMLWDWKTASRAYDVWEYERFAVQPTVYGAAARIEGWIEDPVPFMYAVMVKPKGESQMFVVHRNMNTQLWLEEQLTQIVDMDQANLSTWPLNDNGWWCSEKWCPLWASCKGFYPNT